MSAEQKKLLKNSHILEQGPLHSTVLRYIHMVNTRYIPVLIYFFQNDLGWIEWTMAQNQKVYVEKCQLVAMGIFRFAAFLTRFSSVRGFIFRLFKKKTFFSSSSFSQFHSLSVIFWLALSNANCSFLPTQRSYCFALILQERSPKLFLWILIYFIKKMLLLLLQSVCMLCYDVH